MTKDVMAAILERRSIRHYLPEAIPEATIGRLIDAARWAPSAGNVQPCKFYVVRSPEKKEMLSAAITGRSFLTEAPVVIVVCVNTGETGAKYGQRGEELYCLQDAAAAIQNILLAVTGFGLGSCWVGAFDEASVSKSLNLPPELRPVAMLPIGYPGKTPNPTARKSLDDITVIVD